MRNKIPQKELKRKAQEVKNIIKGIVNDTIDIPDNAIILDTNILIEFFTKKRIELIQFINQHKPQSVQELANLTGRKKQAVDRDLKMLERHGLLIMKKKGREVVPIVERKFLVMGLTDIYPLKSPEKLCVKNTKEKINPNKVVLAEAYIGHVNVNDQLIADLRC